ncbi:unnamed protein product, partial [Ixodes pacificus]
MFVGRIRMSHGCSIYLNRISIGCSLDIRNWPAEGSHFGCPTDMQICYLWHSDGCPGDVRRTAT